MRGTNAVFLRAFDRRMGLPDGDTPDPEQCPLDVPPIKTHAPMTGQNAWMGRTARIRRRRTRAHDASAECPPYLIPEGISSETPRRTSSRSMNSSRPRSSSPAHAAPPRERCGGPSDSTRASFPTSPSPSAWTRRMKRRGKSLQGDARGSRAKRLFPLVASERQRDARDSSYVLGLAGILSGRGVLPCCPGRSENMLRRDRPLGSATRRGWRW